MQDVSGFRMLCGDIDPMRDDQDGRLVLEHSLAGAQGVAAPGPTLSAGGKLRRALAALMRQR
jgi:hypothetical protein